MKERKSPQIEKHNFFFLLSLFPFGVSFFTHMTQRDIPGEREGKDNEKKVP